MENPMALGHFPIFFEKSEKPYGFRFKPAKMSSRRNLMENMASRTMYASSAIHPAPLAIRISKTSAQGKDTVRGILKPGVSNHDAHSASYQ